MSSSLPIIQCHAYVLDASDMMKAHVLLLYIMSLLSLLCVHEYKVHIVTLQSGGTAWPASNARLKAVRLDPFAMACVFQLTI